MTASRNDLCAPALVALAGGAICLGLRKWEMPSRQDWMQRSLFHDVMELRRHSRLSTAALADAVRRAAGSVSPAMKVTSVTLQSTLVANSMLTERLLALLSGFFALVSLAMAAVGLYGVLSYSVVQQTREIGIRVALGAPRRVVIRGVLGALAVYVLAGIVSGVAAGLYLSQFVAKLLFEISPAAAASIVLPVTTLLAVATLAALLPARRAASVDPVVALRDE